MLFRSPVVKGINLTIQEGEFVILIGPSGCGKTTTLKMLNRLIPMDSGDILINGKSIKEQEPELLRRNIGYVIQHCATAWGAISAETAPPAWWRRNLPQYLRKAAWRIFRSV